MLLLLLFALMALPPAALSQQSPVFQAETDLVNTTAVVRSTSGSLLGNLSKDDFEVIEDGVPQAIQFFARETELPLSLGVVVDVSGSQDKFLKQHNKDVAKFLAAVLKPGDQAFAVCFGNRLRLVSERSPDTAKIMDGLERFQKGDRHFPIIGPEEDRDLGTAFYDALYFSIADELKTTGERRRALIVFSDGEENSSEHDLMDVIEAAQNSDTVVYCIRYTGKHHGTFSARNKYGARVMKHISSLSGAADFDGTAERLDGIFVQIGEELRSLYQIGYISSNGRVHDGSFRKVAIRCKEPGSSVRSKSGYYAR